MLFEFIKAALSVRAAFFVFRFVSTFAAKIVIAGQLISSAYFKNKIIFKSINLMSV